MLKKIGVRLGRKGLCVGWVCVLVCMIGERLVGWIGVFGEVWDESSKIRFGPFFPTSRYLVNVGFYLESDTFGFIRPSHVS